MNIALNCALRNAALSSHKSYTWPTFIKIVCRICDGHQYEFWSGCQLLLPCPIHGANTHVFAPAESRGRPIFTVLLVFSSKMFERGSPEMVSSHALMSRTNQQALLFVGNAFFGSSPLYAIWETAPSVVFSREASSDREMMACGAILPNACRKSVSIFAI